LTFVFRFTFLFWLTFTLERAARWPDATNGDAANAIARKATTWNGFIGCGM
jgi:hypothetical protein